MFSSMFSLTPLAFELPDAAPFLILFGNSQLHSLRNRPLYTDLRIIPDDAVLIVRMIEIRTFIGKLRVFRKHQKTMGKIFRDKELLFIFRGKAHAVPLSVGGRTLPEIYRHIRPHR